MTGSHRCLRFSVYSATPTMHARSRNSPIRASRRTNIVPLSPCRVPVPRFKGLYQHGSAGALVEPARRLAGTDEEFVKNR